MVFVHFYHNPGFAAIPTLTEAFAWRTLLSGDRMIISFNQPAFIPWGGVFARLLFSDRMVLLDDTWLARGFTFVNRNRVKTMDGVLWVTVPLERVGRGRQVIRDLKIHEKPRWAKRFSETLRHHYARSPWFDAVMARLTPALEDPDPGFMAMVLPIMESLRRFMDLPARFLLQSRLGVKGRGVELHVAACQASGAESVLLPSAAAACVDWRYLQAQGISVNFMRYEPPVTPQFWGDFRGNLSILDSLFCIGPDATRRLISAASAVEPVT